MASVRDHLAEFHKTASSHHGEMAEHHAKLAKIHASMAKAAPTEDSTTYSEISSTHGALAKSHTAHAAFHKTASEACSKAQQDALAKTVVPDRISSVIPRDAPDSAFGIRAVVRPGQPSIERSTLDAIAPQFRHLVGTGDE